MFEKLIAVLERIAAALEKTCFVETNEVIAKVEPAAASPLPTEKRTRRTKKEMAEAGATLTPNITPEPVAPVVPVVAAPLASAPVPVTRETVRAALIAYSNKTSQDATLALLEKACGTRVMSKVPEEKFQVVLDALAGVLPVADATPFNT
jgi:hypothetical protein